MSISEMNLARRLNYRDRYFLGKVVNNNDPTKLRRCQIRVDELWKEVDDADLPWVSPRHMSPIGNTSAAGHFGVPINGSYVFVKLETVGGEADAHIPYYQCMPCQAETLLPLEATNYPHRYGWQDETGNWFYVDRQSGDMEIKHFSGTTIHIDSQGTLTFTGVKDVVQNITGNVTQTIGGNVSSTISGTLDVEVTGTATVKSTDVLNLQGSNVNITGATIAMHGNVTVSGTAAVDGALSSGTSVADPTGTMQAMRDTYNIHTNPSNGTSPPPQQM